MALDKERLDRIRTWNAANPGASPTEGFLLGEIDKLVSLLKRWRTLPPEPRYGEEAIDPVAWTITALKLMDDTDEAIRSVPGKSASPTEAATGSDAPPA
jgi:hypothetical protein